MCGQDGYFGTGAFQVLLNMRKMSELGEMKELEEDEEVENLFEIDNPNDKCSMSNITIKNNANTVKEQDMGELDDDYDLDF